MLIGMTPPDTTASGFLLVLAIMLPVIGILFSLVAVSGVDA